MIKKIFSFIVKHIDKVLHFSISFGLLVAAEMYFPFWAAVIFASVAGLFKELIDKYVLKTVWSNADLIADVLGIVLAILLIVIRNVIGG